jgi:twitching motility protein PilI
MSQGQLSPVRLLLELERRSRSHAAELPQKLEMMEMWNGIAFRIGDTQLIAPMDEVAEILHMPSMSRVPNAKAWVLGIANVRGNLLPVMDLSGFLLGKNTRINKRSRILVVDHDDVRSGLIVDEVFGMRHFERESWSKRLPKVNQALTPYVDRCYQNEERTWLVFSMFKLAESPLFLQVGF